MSKPQQPQNSSIGTPLRIQPAAAAQNLRNFVAGANGQGVTGDLIWVLLESIRNLEEGCKSTTKKNS
jgi:hypothetical protein